jgi:hypothetical protein
MKMNNSDDLKLATPCGLYCGVCVEYLDKSCHGCRCTCGCAILEYHRSCDIYKCCVDKKGLKSCKDCEELPCSKLIQFCYSPTRSTHLPVIENLRRQKTIGTEKWLKEQREVWSNEVRRKQWLWLHKEDKSKSKISRTGKKQ